MLLPLLILTAQVTYVPPWKEIGCWTTEGKRVSCSTFEPWPPRFYVEYIILSRNAYPAPKLAPAPKINILPSQSRPHALR